MSNRRELVPEGEPLRRAVTWISDRRREQPAAPLWKLIEEASVRFDLSPMDQQFLLRALTEA